MPTAQEVNQKATAAVRKATSVSIYADFGDLVMALNGRTDGTNEHDVIKRGGQTADIIRVGGSVYARNATSGPYRKLSSTVAAGLDRDSLPAALSLLDTAQASPGPVTRSEVAGKSAYVLTDAQGEKIYIAADGSWLPIAVVGSSSLPGKMSLSRWNAVPAVAAPAGSQLQR